jgi:hypothetical protein
MTPVAWIWVSCLAFAGCSVREGANHAQRCDVSADCSTGLVCYRNFCVPGPGQPDGRQAGDKPRPGDAGPDASASSPVFPHDSGSPALLPGLDASTAADLPGAESGTPLQPDGTDPPVTETDPPAAAVDASAPPIDSATPAVIPGSCEREVLRQRADAYLAAMAAGDVTPLKIHPALRYTENGETVRLGLGLWSHRPKAQFVRLVLDEVRCSSVIMGVFTGNNGREIVGVRLRYLDEQLLESEAQVVAQNFQFFDPAAIIPDGPDPWVEPVAAATRMSREALNQLIANYFDSVSDESLLPPHDPACRRRQDGVLMAQQGSCGIPPGDHAFTEKRYPVVDEANGIVTAIVIYDRYVGMYLIKASGGLIQNIDIVGGAQSRSSGW